ncbi:LysE family translocator [Streptomyces sp. NPDC054796]
MSPGPASVLVMRQTLYGGRRIAVLSILGIASGLIAWVVSAALGLTAVIASSEASHQVIRVLGAAVLVILGARTLLAARRARRAEEGAEGAEGAEVAEGPDGADGAAGAPRPAAPKAAYQAGLLTCLTNPKVVIFAAALLPQFVSAGKWSGWVGVVYALVWAATSSVWYVFLMAVLRRMRWIYERPAVRRRLEQFSGLVLLGFGLRLAMTTSP